MSDNAEVTRGRGLSIWLGVVMIASIFTIITYLVLGEQTLDNLELATGNRPGAWSLYVLALLGVLNVVAVVGLWGLNKWGFYVFCGTAAVALVINILIGIPIFQAILGLIGLGIMWALVRNKWAYMS